MPTFRTAEHIEPLLAEVMKTYHPDLFEAGVMVGVLTAHAKEGADGEPRGPALTHHGSQAAAVIKITSQADRAAGLPDCILKLDGDRWDTWTTERQTAILDHELTHVLLDRDADGTVRTDDSNRPKLKMRPHDVDLGIFEDVVKRHKEHAGESVNFAEAHKIFTQALFPWGMT